MTVTLSADDQKLVKEQIASGRFATAEAVVTAALNALREREDHERTGRERIKRLLDERWEKANAPDTQWLDGEQVMTELEAEITEAEKTNRNG